MKIEAKHAHDIGDIGGGAGGGGDDDAERTGLELMTLRMRGRTLCEHGYQVQIRME